MGVVYKAEDVSLADLSRSNFFRITWLRIDRCQNDFAEARAASALNHICTIHEICGKKRATYLLSWNWMEGAPILEASHRCQAAPDS